jgi:hypothetical protein
MRYLATANVFSYLSRRNATLEQQVGQSSGAMTGVELAVSWNMLGATARMFGGSFSADVGDEAVGEVSRADVDLRAGPKIIAGQIGYGIRSFTGAFGTRRWSFVRVGARSAVSLGETGLRASLAAATYLGVSSSHDTGGGSGGEAETRLTYQFPSWPLYAALGYRIERFTVEDTVYTRPEETSGVLIAVGVRLTF